MSTTTLIIIIIVVAVIVLLLLAVYFSMRRSRAQRSEQQRERTREEFGSEYERTAEARGSEEEAERELRERRGRVERQVEPLSEESRGAEERWGEVERVFVDNPSRSIELADRTVMEILEERNFVSDPSQSDEETERSLAVMHPDVADDYREARRIRADVVAGVGRFSEESSEEETTEELRQGIQRYRVVYRRLVSG